MKIRKLLWLIPLLLASLVAIAIYEEFFASNNYERIEIADYDSDPTLSREDKKHGLETCVMKNGKLKDPLK